MKKLGGCFVLRKQGLTEKLRGKCLEFSGNLRNFALDGSNDRAPAFMNLGLRRSFIKRRSNMRGSPMLIISEYVEIARCR